MLATELKTGKYFKENDVPYKVIKYQHIKVARGGANVKVKAKNLVSGAVLEKSYLATAKVGEANVRRSNAQYLYKDSNGYVFMDPNSYEQINISEDIVGDSVKYIKEGETVQVLYFESNPISIDLPNAMVFKVAYTEPGFKGDTAVNVFKDATLENGLIIKVPMFIKVGDKVKVNTISGEYVSKA